jgi:transposase
MSLRLPQPVPPVPDDTARIARAAFPRGNPYLLLRDRLGPVFDDAGFADLYPRRGQPGYTPWRLALVTLLQFREGLSDRQAAEALRARIDWKYLLALDLADAGFDQRCFASSAPGCWPEVLPSACSPACWTWPTRRG